METVIRAATIYLFLLIIFRIMGRRAVGEMTQFDFVLVLILGESTQQALLGDDFSLVNCFITVATLLGIDFLLSVAKQRSPRVEQWVDGLPIILYHDGKFEKECMRRERVDETDILEQARASHGLESFDDVKYAILEKSGKISVVPQSKGD